MTPERDRRFESGVESSVAGVESRVAVVTGASSGIGAATARELAARGWTVGIVARRRERLEDVLADCTRTAPDSRLWVADLSDPNRAAEIALECWTEFGCVDALVNNAAIPMRKPIQRITFEEVTKTMQVNFFSPASMSLALVPLMIERGTGTIVNVSSMGGRVGIGTEAAYSASKFAVCGWSESMAADLEGTGVRVRLVLPGPIATEIWDQPGNDESAYSGPLEPPEIVAVGIADAIDADRFEHYYPDMKAVVDMKNSDIDGFIAGMAAMRHEKEQHEDRSNHGQEHETAEAAGAAGGEK